MTTLTVMAAAAVLVSVPATAQQTTVQEDDHHADSHSGGLDSVTDGAVICASELIGMSLHDARGRSLAEIHDVVINARRRSISYVAVTYGGFLGMGDKLFAVPFEAIQVRQDPDDADRTLLILNVTEEQLEGAEEFDQENWPNFADPDFVGQLDRRYGVDRGARRGRDSRRGISVDVNSNGVDVNVN